MFDWFFKTLPKNTFYALLEMILHIYTHRLAFTFPKKNVID